MHGFVDLYGGPARLLRGRAAGLDLLVLDAPHLYLRPGGPYQDPSGQDWPDNAWRFAALARAGAEVARGRAGNFVPDAVHAHEWQSGLLPAYLRAEGGPPVVMTIHNLAFQGRFPAPVFATLGLPPSAWGIDGVEYLWRRRLSEGRHRDGRCGDHGLAELCRRDPHRRGRHGAGRAAAPARRAAAGHSQRHRHHGLGPGDRRAAAGLLQRGAAGRAEPQQGGAAGAAGAGCAARHAAVRRGQPAHLAEGSRPAAGGAAGAAGHRRATRRAGRRRAGAGGRLHRRRAGASRAGSAA